MVPVPRRNRPHQTALNHTLAASGLTAVPRTPAEEEDRASALLDLALSLLDSAIDLLSNHITADRQLQQPSRLLPGGTLGKHLRHVIETFQAFVRPLADRPGASRPGERDRVLEINYDAIRPSSERGPLARSVPVCRKAMGAVRADLARWRERCRANQPTAELGEGVAGEAGTHGLTGEFGRRVHLVAVTPTRQEMSSSVGRELWFCSLHAIHHFSMLRTIAVHEVELKLPPEFGTAPSTLLYRKKRPDRQGSGGNDGSKAKL